MAPDYEFDLVIIGAGLGGSAVAYALREAGLRVLILERGEYLRQESENWDPSEVISNRRYDPEEEWVDQDGNRFNPRVYYNVGGSSKFFGGVALRFRREDFRARSYADGDTVAWPITYEDLAPFYDEAERLMWVHGQHGRDFTEPPRGEFPGPPLEHEPQIAWLSRRMAGLGLRPFPVPMAIDQGLAGRCQKGSPCDGFPCKIRAKGDGENSFLRPALRARGNGTVEVRTGARVIRLNHDEGGNRVTSVECLSGGERQTIAAHTFVLAAGAANSAALLLQSNSARFPSGLANSSGQVGRNFMAHNNTVLMAFSPFRRNPTRFQKTLAINDFYFPRAGDAGRTGNARPTNGATQLTDRPQGHIQMRGKVVEQNLKKSPRRLVRTFARFIAARSFDFWVMSEDLPSPDNRVELTEDLEIRLSRTLNNLGPHRALVKEFKRIVRRIGLPFVIEREPSPRTIQHQCGTLRFGADPKSSVVDPWGRSHDLPNLYVVDGSVFPSSAAVNPALTIAANALRVGGHIRQEQDQPPRDWSGGRGAH